ncbi:DUF2808 domain-containing protein [Acaryochloris sp. 'Moss Beach']|uniref:DUF2808 domain-containing protein n=1 Tax=Acaryochloris sp. 'Moss Beach' TaxID=2740837 RepID=UPI001F2A911F|nr:DUF2808 domain-containing protein [Acaryochloris sp. 'Moss Beach']UJB70747.1 DUF2808 domain-containing protein [Acaryochloris sp. 'Moss Beach']
MQQFNVLLPALAVGTALVIVQPAQALSGTEVNQIAKESTILVKGQNPGSGVLVGKKDNTYFVLTAEHVVATPDEYDIVAPDGTEYALNYQSVQKLPNVDLALVSFTSKQSYSLAKLGNSDQLTEGDKVFISGWPASGSALPHIYQFTSGEISGLPPQSIGKGYKMVYTNVTRAGMSGGPVFNDDGKVVGIHGLAEGREVVLPGYQGDRSVIKAGFNLGIPINTFVRLSNKMEAKPQATPQPIPTPIQESTAVAQVIDAPTLPTLPRGPKVTFDRPPQLVSTSTTNRDARSLGATYFFTIDIPQDAAQPLQKLEFILKQGVQYPRFKATSVKAFEGTKRNKGEALPINIVVSDPSIRTLTVTFDKPVAPGRTITMAVRPVRNPSVGTYMFEVRGTPAGTTTKSQYIGIGRLDFSRSSLGK